MDPATPPTKLRIFSIGDVTYKIHMTDQPAVVCLAPSSAISLATVFDVKQEGQITFDVEWLKSKISFYQTNDDVFQNAFLRTIIIHGVKDENIKFAPDTLGVLEERSPFVQLDAPLTNNGLLAVAVPSRLRYQPSSDQPLAGLRIAVKDNLHLAGLKTSLCNKAYYNVYPKRTKTAKCNQQLLDAGAVVLGKTKMNSFGCWEEPTEYIDYQAPWNPRADGYQSPGGSSSGSGAAVAAYGWIDITIGTDTGGSVARPGLWNGCFAMRPSFGLVPVEGLVTSIKAFDMPGLLGRDLHDCKNLIHHWYGSKSSLRTEAFTRIVWASDFWGWCGPKSRDLAERFVLDLEAVAGLSHEKISFREKWAETCPEVANGTSLDDYMQLPADDIWYDDYHNHENFRADYWKRFQKAPYIRPAVRNGWDYAKTITQLARDEAVARLEIYRVWFSKNIMNEGEGHTMLMVPIEDMEPRYRDEFMDPVRGHPGVCALLLAPVIKAPQLVVPIGEIPYKSKVTELEAVLPFAVGSLGLPDL
ncbi:uncharacterized protein RCO7_09544 [Rhynchosporium graminicola]|uniref:Uncharacterized protein n=1 Tax=Rhynchosporium graminicola TaxID=2792576 RepID=A0A1E1K636_9HELO|nr:uncharacterized protein RCO7_09544 [Rhynchosporium commune]